MSEPAIAAILIGRNEGERLLRCLASVGGVDRVIYVDSGSTDGSGAAAEAAGAEVVALDMSRPFTAARARNAGIARLHEGALPVYVQFIDGDCELQPGWIDTARAFLDAHPKAAVACGRRRERFPGASVYNRLCDGEWDTPVGEAAACGGDALIRMAALDEVGGYRETMIAGEEPEMCLRLGRRGWQIWRLDAEMTLHDAAMTRFSQWWARSRRAGHAWAEAAALHGRGPERHGVRGTWRALLWGLALPLAALLLALLVSPWALALLLVYPAQIVRMALRAGPKDAFSWQQAWFTALGKFPEMLGVLEYARGCLTQRRSGLIEYK
ncbi:glycosyltransferase [Rhodobacteraceae bacterium NNCM2]|nr:glycosyltransferase [Coraliihabitans acroporae]